MHSYPAIALLMRPLRELLANRDLDKAFDGGVKSTILFFMILTMLECDPISIELQGAGQLECTQPDIIEALFLRFLHYFGGGAGEAGHDAAFQYEESTIEIRVQDTGAINDDAGGPAPAGESKRERFSAAIRQRQSTSTTLQECLLQMTASVSLEPGAHGGSHTRRCHYVPYPLPSHH